MAPFPEATPSFIRARSSFVCKSPGWINPSEAPAANPSKLHKIQVHSKRTGRDGFMAEYYANLETYSSTDSSLTSLVTGLARYVVGPCSPYFSDMIHAVTSATSCALSVYAKLAGMPECFASSRFFTSSASATSSSPVGRKRVIFCAVSS